ncbi:MAG: macro domain-containing protein [Candidatus Krumholzibacteriia bacterium]
MTGWRSRLTLIRGDITVQDTDVIVNAANTQLRRGGGVCGAIHAAAGPGLARECEEIGHCATGEAVATGGYDLPAAAVIHTVGPVWDAGGGDDEDDLLAACFRESLALCAELGHASISFPSISTGIYGFPVERAAPIALAAIREGLADHPGILEVRMVCFSAADLAAYERALARLA